MTKKSDQTAMHARVQQLLDQLRDEDPQVSEPRLVMRFMQRADQDLQRFFIEQIADEARRLEVKTREERFLAG
jgi:hypothetical protein